MSGLLRITHTTLCRLRIFFFFYRGRERFQVKTIHCEACSRRHFQDRSISTWANKPRNVCVALFKRKPSLVELHCQCCWRPVVTVKRNLLLTESHRVMGRLITTQRSDFFFFFWSSHLAASSEIPAEVGISVWELNETSPSRFALFRNRWFVPNQFVSTVHYCKAGQSNQCCCLMHAGRAWHCGTT